MYISKFSVGSPSENIKKNVKCNLKAFSFNNKKNETRFSVKPSSHQLSPKFMPTTVNGLFYKC